MSPIMLLAVLVILAVRLVTRGLPQDPFTRGDAMTVTLTAIAAIVIEGLLK